jgi:lipid-binding SYLF domain-containing protein
MKKVLYVFMALLMVSAVGHFAIAGEGDSAATDEQDRLIEANTVVKEVLAIPENGIPQEMLDNAAAVIVIPDLLKAGFIAGVKAGEGVMSAHTGTGWTRPSFVELKGGSIGWQAGVESTDLVLVFMSEKHVQKLLNGEFAFGADASVTVGPIGRQASAGTNQDAKSAIYAYSRSKGVFAGISLDGSKVSIDKESNTKIYGTDNAHNIMYGGQGNAPAEAETFKTTLNSVTKANNPKAKS